MTYNMAEYFTCRQKFKAHSLNSEPKAQNDCELKAKSICLSLLYEFNGQNSPFGQNKTGIVSLRPKNTRDPAKCFSLRSQKSLGP